MTISIAKQTVMCLLILLCCTSCRKSTTRTAFYYWKTKFEVSTDQQTFLQKTNSQVLYPRVFDIVWDDTHHQPKPNAVLQMGNTPSGIIIRPVIFIANNTFKQITSDALDSLAYKSVKLLAAVAAKARFNYDRMQIDCDWTDQTQDKYFAYLKAVKKYANLSLEATIRLHQIKYRERTGVPPVDRGILMFYNMGHLKPGQSRNSIYNTKDAARYLDRLPGYPLTLDVALPIFSWTIHSRHNQILQLYTKIGSKDLHDAQRFKYNSGTYTAIKSFFMKRIYIKENDSFKLEETDLNLLNEAAETLAAKLKPIPDRTIIYYELANINQPEFTPQALSEITAHF
jgi:hypothetical protein